MAERRVQLPFLMSRRLKTKAASGLQPEGHCPITLKERICSAAAKRTTSLGSVGPFNAILILTVNCQQRCSLKYSLRPKKKNSTGCSPF